MATKLGSYLTWKSKLSVLVFTMFFAIKVQGRCSPPFVDINNDVTREHCVYVLPSQVILSFAEARVRCQDADPRADLIKLLSSDIPDIFNHPGFSSQSKYLVGLTRASDSASPVNVIDCSPYDATTQPLMSAAECANPPCDCWVFVPRGGNLDQVNCLEDQHELICVLSEPDDYSPTFCPFDWEPIGSRCYRYFTDQTQVANFDEAQTFCVLRGAKLATLNFYDCDYAAVLAGRNEMIPYLVGLMGAPGSEQWRDGTMPIQIFVNDMGSDECFLLEEESVDDMTGVASDGGGLRSTQCSNNAPNFICEMGSSDGLTTFSAPTTEEMIFESTTPGDEVTTDGSPTGATTDLSLFGDDIFIVAPTGVDMVTANWGEPNLPSLTFVASSHQPLSSQFGIGQTEVVYLFADMLGNFHCVTFIVEVVPESPILVNDMEKFVPEGEFYRRVNWREPYLPDMTLVSSSHQPVTSQFALGVTEVVYVFANEAGDFCCVSFSVEAIPESPILVNDMEKFVPEGEFYRRVNWREPYLPDMTLVSSSHQPVTSQFALGVTEVVYVFANEAGDFCCVSFSVEAIPVDITTEAIETTTDEMM